MQKIALITDSASDLNIEMMEKFNIKSAPFRIIYSNNEYEDRVTITPQEVYSNLTKEIPTTSLPNISRIEDILNEIEAEGYTHAIVINISSGLSGTSNSFRLLLEDHPNLVSYVFDSKTLSMAEGAIVLEVAKLIAAGESFENIILELPNLRKNVHVYFTLNTLEYLKKGGRIGKVAGTIGEILNLKPLIYVSDEGVYVTHAKSRGRKQSLSKLNEVLDGYLSKSKCNLWIVEGDAKEESNILFNLLKDNPQINKIEITTLGPALGVHTGPGLLGFIIQEVK
jgi:DegV family protein with EDD domain